MLVFSEWSIWITCVREWSI